MIGQTISHYRIVEKLGEGGMGVVYKAQDTKLLRSVALKFLAPEMTRDQDAKKRFIQEAQAASALDHPNIAVVHAIDETNDGRSFICMAYYEGQTLKDKITSGPLSIREAVHIAVQIANGLQRAHESGIVHRDIKPGNIMITPRGEVKIVDFGLAKLAAQTRPTRTGPTAGTAAYMSPEQVLGSEADNRSDLFSLGVLLYEAATGKRPFVGEHEPALFYSIANADPAPPSTVRSDMPQELERIILRLLEKDPNKRYQSAAEVRADLKQFLGEAPTPRPVIRVPVVFRGRLSLPIVIGSAVLIVAAVLFASGALQKWFGGSALPEQKHIVVLPFTNIGGDSSKKALCDGLFERITSGLAQLHALRRDLWVVAPSEARKFTTVGDAYRGLGITIAVVGSFQWTPNYVQVTVNLVDAKSSLVIDSEIIDSPPDITSQLESKVVSSIAGMMGIKLRSADLGGLAAGNSKDEKAYELYVQARGYLQEYTRSGRLDVAINLFQRATRVDPSYALAYAGLGEAYWRRYETTKDHQWVDSAVSACTRAVKLNDQLAPIYVTLGMVYRGTGKYADAIQAFQRVLAIDSLNADAYRELGDAYGGEGDTALAVAAYKKAIDLRPSDWSGYNYLGRFYYRSERNEDAIEAWKKVIELTPHNRTGYTNLGAAYYRLKRWREAIEQFERSIQIDTNNYAAYSNLGTAYYYDGLFDRAARAYEKALQINPKDYRVWGHLAAAYHAMGSNRLAQESYEKAASMAEEERRINPRDPTPLYHLAGYYADLGKETEARSLLHQAVLLAPNDVNTLGRVGLVNEQLGQREQALKWLALALKKGYSTTDIDYDPEMRSLRKDPRYQQLSKDGRTKERQ
jgi:serine/threonine-protein kinase